MLLAPRGHVPILSRRTLDRLLGGVKERTCCPGPRDLRDRERRWTTSPGRRRSGRRPLPVWSPGGDRSSHWAALRGDDADWFTLPFQGGPAQKNGGLRGAGRAALGIHRLADRNPADRMACRRPRLFAPARATPEIFGRSLSGGKRAGRATRITQGPGLQLHASIGAGQR